MPEAPIDDAAFAELLETVGGDREFLAELVDTYLADSPGLFAELRAAIAADDAATARRAAHTLKSTSASFGANGLAAQCREIEAMAATRPAGRVGRARRSSGRAAMPRSKQPCVVR